MTKIITNRRALLGAIGGITLLTGAETNAAPVKSKSAKAKQILAPKPPMGWNSWNSFATTINEEQSLENANIMAQKLLPFGYNIFTIDIQWYEPNAKSYTYNSKPIPSMDEYGRLIPAPNRFPSSVNGVGFKAIADKVHSLGLKFGIHLMRGIPRYAVEQNTKVLGTNYTARDIANTKSTCPWNPDMYGVDMSKKGAQEYYNSVFALYASWGVDFIKMDDMSRPYDAHAKEIEAAHFAIQNTKKPIILSLSPGETPVARASHVAKYAQMWRISDDFWDEWHLLNEQFTRLENWNEHRKIGAWPDADMLPLGKLALGERDTKFTHDEQKTLMTLWSIARSPLIMGGDLRHLDAHTLDLLTNKDIININQNTTENRPHFLEDNTRIWSARDEKNPNKYYVALFNTADKSRNTEFDLENIANKTWQIRDIWENKDIGAAKTIKTNVPAHGTALFALN